MGEPHLRRGRALQPERKYIRRIGVAIEAKIRERTDCTLPGGNQRISVAFSNCSALSSRTAGWLDGQVRKSGPDEEDRADEAGRGDAEALRDEWACADAGARANGADGRACDMVKTTKMERKVPLAF